MNQRIQQLALESGAWHQVYDEERFMVDSNFDVERFAELIVKEYASEYNKLINGEAVVLPKDREHAEALVRVGMFYLENNK